MNRVNCSSVYLLHRPLAGMLGDYTPKYVNMCPCPLLHKNVT